VAALACLGVGLAPGAARADWVRNDEWQLGALNALAAWQHSTGSGTIVAVLDSGVDASHPDLVGQVLPGLDLVDGSSDGRVDPVGHGTTVASLIAGRRDDAGVVGLAPDARILPVRVLDRQNRYDDAAVVARGLRWAVDKGARVVNLSLGGLAQSDVLADALRYAAEHDVVVVACTGNLIQSSADPEVWYPAREPGVVAVAGLRAPASATGNGGDWLDRPTGPNAAEQLWSGSLTGPQTVLTAPAAGLIGARPGGYWRVQGTSFAAPLVAGAAALVRSRYPGMNAANVINRLIRTADDLGVAGRDDRYGFGQVNPLVALTAEVSGVPANPLVTGADPASQAGTVPSDGAAGPGLTTGLRPTGEPGGSGQPGGGAPNPDGNNAVGFAEPRDRPTESITGGSSRMSPLAMVALLFVSIAGALLFVAVTGGLVGRRQLALRYLRRPLHATTGRDRAILAEEDTVVLAIGDPEPAAGPEPAG
jgi:subtilisin family serine protease